MNTKPYPAKDINDRPFSPELSPWAPAGHNADDINHVPQATHFALPALAQIAQWSDQWWDDSEWTVTAQSDTVGVHTYPFIRAIADDIVLYRRMRHYAKTGEALAGDDHRLIQVGDWITRDNGTSILSQWHTPFGYRLATSDEIKSHLANTRLSPSSTNPTTATMSATYLAAKNPPNFIIDCTNIDADLLQCLYDLLKRKGFTQNNPPSLTPLSKAYPCLCIYRNHPNYCSDALYVGLSSVGSVSNLPRYSPLTQFPEIVRILSEPITPPLPPAPCIYDQTAVYKAGDKAVVFGCARLALEHLRAVQQLFSLPFPDGNRTVESVTLSSGKTLSREQVRSILEYVNAVDKAAIAKATE